ncbi:DUF7144 family membrane protein [Blastococcus sp. SYSU D01042]
MSFAAGAADDAWQRERVRPYADVPSRRGDERPGTSWALFAVLVLTMVGLFHVAQGLVALLDDGSFAVGPDGLIVGADYPAWGTAHLVVGVLAIAAGVGLIAGSTVARVAAVVLAALSAVVALAWLPAQPAWSLLVIGLDIAVIHAVVVHGRALTTS